MNRYLHGPRAALLTAVMAIISIGALATSAAPSGPPAPAIGISAAAQAPTCAVVFETSADSAARAHLRGTRLTTYQVRTMTRVDSLAAAHCNPIPYTPPEGIPNPVCVAAFGAAFDTTAKVHLPSTRLTTYQKRALARTDSMALVHCDVIEDDPPTPPANDAPVGAYTFACSGATCNMNAGTSTDDNAIVEYMWRANSRPTKYGVVISRTRNPYPTGVEYAESLFVTDASGLADTVVQLIPAWDTTTTPPPPVVVDTSVAELPRALPTTPASMDTLPCTVNVSSGGLQAALTAANPSSGAAVLCLTASSTHSGNFTVPSRAGAGWVVLRTAGSLPSGRMRPSTAGSLAKLVSGSTAAALRFNGGARRTLVLGVEITSVTTLTTGPTALVEVGLSSETSIAALPSDIVFERIYIHGWGGQNIRRAFAFNGAAQTVKDSWCSEIHAFAFDSQCVASWNGYGPMLIENNYLEAASENIAFGGSPGGLASLGVEPADVTIRRNHIAKPIAWKGNGKGWNVKNLIESKYSVRVLVEDNVLEGTWNDAQTGNILLLKSANPGGCTGCNTADWTFRRNLVRNVSDGFALAGKAEMGTGSSSFPVDSTVQRVLIEQNYIEAMAVSPYNGAGRLLTFNVDNRYIVVRQNAFEPTTGTLAAAVVFGDTTTRALEITDNVFGRGLYGLFTGGSSEGLASWNAGPRTPKTWSNNTMLGPTSGAAYPSGTSWITHISQSLLASQIRAIVLAATAGVVITP